jgi:hypothetical protein
MRGKFIIVVRSPDAETDERTRKQFEVAKIFAVEEGVIEGRQGDQSYRRNAEHHSMTYRGRCIRPRSQPMPRATAVAVYGCVSIVVLSHFSRPVAVWRAVSAACPYLSWAAPLA